MIWFRRAKTAEPQGAGLSLDELRAQIAMSVRAAEARIDAIHARLTRAEAESTQEKPEQ